MYRRVVTKEIEEIARVELNETPQNRIETLAHIEEWIKKQPHINLRMGGFWLLNFIRGCKFSTQKVKEKLEDYLKLKHTAPEVFSNRDPLLPPLQDMLKKGSITPFGTPDKECVIVRWEGFDPNKVCFNDILKLASMFLDAFMLESETCMAVGQYVIIDLKGFSYAFLPQITPLTLKRIVYNMLITYPMRIKCIYFINCVSCVETLYNLTKSFLSTKIQNRISFFGDDFNEIFKTIPKKYFPIEYGGCANSIDEIADLWKNEIESCRNWLLDDTNCCLNNVKKVSNGNGIINGTHGSFRKLEFD
ncbi:hypothetical protein RN001_008181 [Aquatica leii]|uniref:CRAL-TRIO domain-containing protein n=1 Tax=Aquatica leii TaxID=1421715 RepID=A0AAN7SR93_9COLE|nr:hypothetical protein RN001_008181 [Aquatica leii]